MLLTPFHENIDAGQSHRISNEAPRVPSGIDSAPGRQHLAALGLSGAKQFPRRAMRP
jgi:hypothetical protein